MWPLPKNSGSNPQTSVFVRGTLGPNPRETSDTCLVSPVALKPRIRRCLAVALGRRLPLFVCVFVRLTRFALDVADFSSMDGLVHFDVLIPNFESD